MIPPDLTIRTGSAISELLVGLGATAVAWFALLVVVAHGRYVTESVAEGRYEKGPFRDRNPRAGSELVDLDERDGDEDG